MSSSPRWATRAAAVAGAARRGRRRASAISRKHIAAALQRHGRLAAARADRHRNARHGGRARRGRASTRSSQQGEQHRAGLQARPPDAREVSGPDARRRPGARHRDRHRRGLVRPHRAICSARRCRFPDGDRIVEVEMRNARGERGRSGRLLHDFVAWRRDVAIARGPRRVPDARAQPGPGRRAPGAGDRRRDHGVGVPARPRAAAARPAAARRRRTTGRAAGRRARLRRVAAAVRRTRRRRSARRAARQGHDDRRRRHAGGLRVPGAITGCGCRCSCGPSGYAPLEGAAVRVFGRLAPGATQAQANAELTALAERAAAASPQTHEHLRPRVLAYGGESPGDQTWWSSL